MNVYILDGSNIERRINTRLEDMILAAFGNLRN